MKKKTFDSLTSRIEVEEVRRIAKAQDQLQKSEALISCYERLYPEWHAQLLCGFNVALYGYGSKREIVNRFARDYLAPSNRIVVINGFSPNAFLQDLQPMLDFDNLIVVVHSADSTSLKFGTIFSMARAGTRWLITIDSVLGAFTKGDFLWHNVSTMRSFVSETANERSIVASQSAGAVTLRSVEHVLRSVTKNASAIFRLLAAEQLESNSPISKQRLFNLARERFLCSNVGALSLLLGEFIDHRIIVSERDDSGEERLSIALDLDSLKAFLEEE